MRINLTHLYQFYVTAKEGSIKKAAKILHVTEPTISKQIKELEEYLEMYLFRRVHNHLELTSIGKELMGKSEHIFQSVEEIEDFIGKYNAELGSTLRFGATPLLHPYLVRFFDMDFADTNIVKMKFYCFGTRELEMALEKTKVDIAVTDVPLSIGGYYCKKIIDIPLVLVGREKFRSLSENFPHSLTDQPYIKMNSYYKVQEDIYQYFRARKVFLAKKIAVDSFHACRDAALLGHGVTVVPRSIVKEELDNGSLIEIAEMPETPLSIWLVALKSRVNEPAIQRAFAHTSAQNQDTLFELREF